MLLLHETASKTSEYHLVPVLIRRPNLSLLLLHCFESSRGGLAVSMSSYETTGPGSILGVAIFPG